MNQGTLDELYKQAGSVSFNSTESRNIILAALINRDGQRLIAEQQKAIALALTHIGRNLR